ncbi:helix-turn-helix domain-containing protein [Glacieibacterium megasporae]|uniref:helix-turn-helix domain-containing protein n=1 Tax=Glacieibacterium megasporae TaxID=2835787 RepID=UPI001C1E704E|nr:helix-turn-helix transcriptional regulator [Polymorphobacter megasporae]UAJ11057.1 helix-turn-helix domain-containing protein [Polymorphobacter megasporae]
MRTRDVVAWNLRSIRTGRGLSQEALADESGVNRSFVSDIERAAVSVSVDILDRIAMALGVDLVTLVTPPAVGSSPPRPLTSGRKPRG